MAETNILGIFGKGILSTFKEPDAVNGINDFYIPVAHDKVAELPAENVSSRFSIGTEVYEGFASLKMTHTADVYDILRVRESLVPGKLDIIIITRNIATMVNSSIKTGRITSSGNWESILYTLYNKFTLNRIIPLEGSKPKMWEWKATVNNFPINYKVEITLNGEKESFATTIPLSPMEVGITSGTAFIKGAYVDENTPIDLVRSDGKIILDGNAYKALITESDPSLDRIDSILLIPRTGTFDSFGNLITMNTSGKIEVIKGIPSVSPVPSIDPASESYKSNDKILVAEVRVNAGATEIFQTDVTDVRHYLVLSSENGGSLNLWTEDGLGSLLPNTNGLQNVGGSSFRTKDIFVGTSVNFPDGTITFDVDGLNVGSAKMTSMKVDTISEKTLNNGILIDNVKIKDGTIILDRNTEAEFGIAFSILDFESNLKNLIDNTGAWIENVNTPGGNVIADEIEVKSSLILNGTSISGIKDEDDMVSNSNVHLATQQSIKTFTVNLNNIQRDNTMVQELEIIYASSFTENISIVGINIKKVVYIDWDNGNWGGTVTGKYEDPFKHIDQALHVTCPSTNTLTRDILYIILKQEPSPTLANYDIDGTAGAFGFPNPNPNANGGKLCFNWKDTRASITSGDPFISNLPTWLHVKGNSGTLFQPEVSLGNQGGIYINSVANSIGSVLRAYNFTGGIWIDNNNPTMIKNCNLDSNTNIYFFATGGIYTVSIIDCIMNGSGLIITVAANNMTNMPTNKIYTKNLIYTGNIQKDIDPWNAPNPINLTDDEVDIFINNLITGSDIIINGVKKFKDEIDIITLNATNMFANGITTNNITSFVENDLILSSSTDKIYLSPLVYGETFYADSINEAVLNNGVTIDGVNIKDAGLKLNAFIKSGGTAETGALITVMDWEEGLTEKVLVQNDLTINPFNINLLGGNIDSSIAGEMALICNNGLIRTNSGAFAVFINNLPMVNIEANLLELGNNTADVDFSANTIQGSAISTATDMGGALSSNTKLVSQLAVKTFVNNMIAGGLSYQNVFDASAGTFVALNDSKKGDLYKISVGGTIDGIVMDIGDMLIVNKDVIGVPTSNDIDKIDNTEGNYNIKSNDLKKTPVHSLEIIQPVNGTSVGTDTSGTGTVNVYLYDTNGVNLTTFALQSGINSALVWNGDDFYTSGVTKIDILPDFATLTTTEGAYFNFTTTTDTFKIYLPATTYLDTVTTSYYVDSTGGVWTIDGTFANTILNPANRLTGYWLPGTEQLQDMVLYKTDKISERTLNNGINIDDVLIKDGQITVVNDPLNPLEIATKQYVDTATVGLSQSYKTDLITVTTTDITNGYLTLSQTPTTPSEVIVIVKGDGGWFYGDDFTVLNNQLTFISPLASGDKISVMYIY